MAKGKNKLVLLKNIPTNSIFEANKLYLSSDRYLSESAYYKRIERMCKKGELVHLTKGLYYKPKASSFCIIPITDKDIVSYYTKNNRGIVIGYSLYNKLGLTTQVSKNIEVLSNQLDNQKKNINNTVIKRLPCSLNKERIKTIEVLEVLQNYAKIEDINNKALVTLRMIIQILQPIISWII